ALTRREPLAEADFRLDDCARPAHQGNLRTAPGRRAMGVDHAAEQQARLRRPEHDIPGTHIEAPAPSAGAPDVRAERQPRTSQPPARDLDRDAAGVADE